MAKRAAVPRKAIVTVVSDKGSSQSGAKQVVVTDGARFFLVSSVIGHTGEPETLVFACDKDGEVEKWNRVAGGIAQTRSQAIADLERRLGDGTLGAPDLADAFMDAVGGPIGVMVSMLDGIGGRSRPRPVDDEFLK